MKVLGAWGLANTVFGAAGLAASKGGQNHYFYQMTTIWGVTNFIIAIPGYIGASRQMGLDFNVAQTIGQQRKIEFTFSVNTILDVAYIGAGFYMDSRGNNTNNPQLKGYGLSIALQGSFLLLFDATMLRTHYGNGRKLVRFLEKNPIVFDGKSIGIQIAM